MRRRWKLGVTVTGLALLAAACPASSDAADLLADVQDRGTLRCGVNDQVPGFGFVEGGQPAGFDIEFCKAVAAAVLGDATKVEYTALTADQRFTALQSAEVDVLIRNTTWTASRDGAEGAAFATTTFYDGQGMMVKSDAGIDSLEDLADDTICVLKGTTTERNLESVFAERDIRYDPLSLDKNETIQPAFVQDRCTGWTSDRSQLAGLRSAWPEAEGGPDALTILSEVMSKEPLGPVVRDGDPKWLDAVNWAVLATILGEELGITTRNADDMKDSDNADIKRLLGEERTDQGEPFDAGLGLPTDFGYQVLKQVGNYKEIYDRTVTPLGLDRGPNRLWTDGGLLYAPPYK